MQDSECRQGSRPTALYQGLTLVGPHKAEREMGLEMPQKNSVLYQGTTLVGPHKAEREMGL
jgi:recombinational DNA repair ATPase RecF